MVNDEKKLTTDHSPLTLGCVYLLQNLVNYILCGYVFRLGFVGKANAVTQYAVRNRSHIIRRYVTTAIEKSLRFRCQGQRNASPWRSTVGNYRL